MIISITIIIIFLLSSFYPHVVLLLLLLLASVLLFATQLPRFFIYFFLTVYPVETTKKKVIQKCSVIVFGLRVCGKLGISPLVNYFRKSALFFFFRRQRVYCFVDCSLSIVCLWWGGGRVSFAAILLLSLLSLLHYY